MHANDLGNKVIRREESKSYYAIVVPMTKDPSVLKLVSRDFPHTYPYTVKPTQAKRFKTMEEAETFITQQRHIGYPFEKYEIVLIRKIFKVEPLWKPKDTEKEMSNAD